MYLSAITMYLSAILNPFYVPECNDYVPECNSKQSKQLFIPLFTRLKLKVKKD